MLRCQNGKVGWGWVTLGGVVVWLVVTPSSAFSGTSGNPADASTDSADAGVAPPEPSAGNPVRMDARDTVVALRDRRVVAQLCEAVRVMEDPPPRGAGAVGARLAQAQVARERKHALQRVYEAEIPAHGFFFADYEADRGVLTLNTFKPFFALGGDLALSTTESDPLEIPLDEPRTRALLQEHEAGQLVLHVWFHLDADPDQENATDALRDQPCVMRPNTSSAKMVVSWLAGELRGPKGQNRGRFLTDNGRRTAVVAQQMVGPTTLALGELDGAGNATPTLWPVLEGRKSALEACHAQHGRNAEGAVVLGLDFGKDGRLTRVGVEVGSLDNDPLEACVLGAVKGGQPPVRGPQSAHVTWSVAWNRD